MKIIVRFMTGSSQNWDYFITRQIEFARLNITYTILSKRFLKQLVEDNYVRGWDDPRMPTLCGMRRRGYPAKAVRNFIDQVGVAKNENLIEYRCLNTMCGRELNRICTACDGVSKPGKGGHYQLS